MDPDVSVLRAGFEQQHRIFSIGAEAVGEHASGRARPDDDVVEFKGFGQSITYRTRCSFTHRFSPMIALDYSRDMRARIAIIAGSFPRLQRGRVERTSSDQRLPAANVKTRGGCSAMPRTAASEPYELTFNSGKQSNCVAATSKGLQAFFSRAHSSASSSQYFISFSAAFARSRHIFSKVLKLRPRCSMAIHPPRKIPKKNNAKIFSESKLNLKRRQRFL